MESVDRGRPALEELDMKSVDRGRPALEEMATASPGQYVS
jgi:hypothetical protein